MSQHAARPIAGPGPALGLDRYTVLPIVVGLAIFALAWFLLATERDRSRAQAQAAVEVAAEQAASRLSVWLEDRLAVLARFARVRAQPDAASDDAFREEARLLIDRVRGFRALNWIDAEGRIAVVVPEFGNRQALGSSLRDHADADVRSAIERALDTLLPSRTTLVPLLQGGQGFAVYWPVDAPGSTHGGVINGVFDLGAMLNQALPEALEDEHYVFSIESADGHELFGSGVVDAAALELEATQEIAFVDRPLRVRATPRELPGQVLVGASYALLLALAATVSVLTAFVLRARLLRADTIARAEAYNRLLLDSTSDGLLGLDLLGRCTYCNSAALDLLGYDDEAELLGGPGLSWIVDDATEGAVVRSVELFGALRAGDTYVAGEVRARRVSGTPFDVAVRSHPVRERGELTGALLSLSDVSRELRESERAHRLMSVLVRVPEVVALIDPGGQLAFLNPAARAVLGVDETDLSSLTFRDFVQQDDVERFLSEILPATAAQNLWQGEVELLSRQGERIPSQLVVMRHVDHHGAIYYSLIARDLRDERAASAERDALEAQFREAQRTESLGLLAGSIAHDFNNMLVGVLGNASLALEQLPAGTPAHHLVGRVQAATEHAAQLVGQLLAYSGRGRFEAATIDVANLVTELTALLRTTIPKRVALDVDALPAGIVADPTQLRQLVMNLVTNAAHAITGTGSIRVDVNRVQLDPEHWPSHDFGRAATGGEWVRVRVEDDGCGMPADILEQIFDPFFTTREDGKGLGLAAVLGIVRGHDGMLDVSSREGVGTRFDLYFPPSTQALPVDAQATRDETSAIGCFAGKVLLVDDEPGVRDYLTAALETLGFDVESCADGTAGVERFRTLHEDLRLVLMDQSMPGLSGDAAWRAMQGIDDAVPGLLMSGYDEVRIDGSVSALGFSAFLHKPFRFQELRAVVEDALDEADVAA